MTIFIKGKMIPQETWVQVTSICCTWLFSFVPIRPIRLLSKLIFQMHGILAKFRIKPGLRSLSRHANFMASSCLTQVNCWPVLAGFYTDTVSLISYYSDLLHWGLWRLVIILNTVQTQMWGSSSLCLATPQAWKGVHKPWKDSPAGSVNPLREHTGQMEQLKMT
jgi:hypothetical protein